MCFLQIVMEVLGKLSLFNATYYFHDNYPCVWVILCNNKVMWIVTHLHTQRQSSVWYPCNYVLLGPTHQRIDIFFGPTWSRERERVRLNICKTDLETLNESLNAIKKFDVKLLNSLSIFSPVSPHDQSFERKFTTIQVFSTSGILKLNFVFVLPARRKSLCDGYCL